MSLFWYVVFQSLLFSPGCHGDEHYSHLVLLDELPAVFGTNATPEIVIRTNYSVSTQNKSKPTDQCLHQHSGYDFVYRNEIPKI